MGHAGLFIVAAMAATALRSIQWLINGDDNVRYRDFMRGASQAITAARATNRVNQIASAQFAEELLQIGEGNALALANAGECHGAVVAP